jgi:hypothetical protein
VFVADEKAEPAGSPRPKETVMQDLVLPSFEMDCRDWLVATPEESGIPEEVDGAPLLAVLSTAVIDADGLRPASGVLTVGLMDDGVQAVRTFDADCPAAEIVEDEYDADVLRFVLPAPTGPLALLAEFTLPDGHDREVVDRVESLMRSFRWAA